MVLNIIFPTEVKVEKNFYTFAREINIINFFLLILLSNIFFISLNCSGNRVVFSFVKSIKYLHFVKNKNTLQINYVIKITPFF